MSSTARGPATEPPGSLILIGRKEYAAFPDWDVWRVRAKVDTGAFSSALGVAGCEWFTGEKGPMVRLRLSSRRRPSWVKVVEVPMLKVVTVTSSSGCLERRPLIEATVQVGSWCRRIRLTVTDRSRMRCPMLLGRQALAGSFLVDPGQKYLLGSGRRG
jgi:hypothetical protein